MRRPRLALGAAVAALGISAPVVAWQSASLAPASSQEPSSTIDPALASRGARYLLRNGVDWLNYKEYARALKFLRAAEATREELGPEESKSLSAAIAQAQRGLREAAPAGTQAARYSRDRRAGALATARPAPRTDDLDHIQLTAAVQAPDGPAVAPATLQAPSGSPADREPEVRQVAAAESTPLPIPDPVAPTAPPAGLPEPSGSLPEPGSAPAPTPLPLPDSGPAPKPADLPVPDRAPTAPGGIELPPLPTGTDSGGPAAPPADAGPAPLPLPTPEPAPTPAPPAGEAPRVIGLDPLPEPAGSSPSPAPAPAPAPSSEPAPTPVPVPTPTTPSPDSGGLPPMPGPDVPVPTPDATPASLPPSDPIQLPPSDPVQLPPSDPVPVPVPSSDPIPVPATSPPSPEPASAPMPTPEPVAVPAEVVPTPLPALPPADEPRPAPTSVPTPEPVPAPAPAAESIPTPAPTPTPAEADSSASRHEQPMSDVDREALERRMALQDAEARDPRQVPSSSLPKPIQIMPLPGESGGAGLGNPTNTSTRFELTRAPAPTEAWPIRRIPVPEEFVPLQPREWEPTRKYWQAPAVCHMPLYFQDASLERYGHNIERFFGPFGRFLTYPLDDRTQSNQRMQIFQPAFSAGLFAFQIGVLPYNLIVDPPWEAEYDLGYYRPGDRVPTDIYYLPLTGVGPPLRGNHY